MKVDNIRKTIESLKASNTYDQDKYYHNCGTPACIAGHAAIDSNSSFKYLVTGDVNTDELVDTACEWFGIKPLSYEESELFGRVYLPDDSSPTKEDAVTMLENWIETGKIDWDKRYRENHA